MPRRKVLSKVYPSSAGCVHLNAGNIRQDLCVNQTLCEPQRPSFHHYVFRAHWPVNRLNANIATIYESDVCLPRVAHCFRAAIRGFPHDKRQSLTCIIVEYSTEWAFVMIRRPSITKPVLVDCSCFSLCHGRDQFGMLCVQ